jgi:hypothetical protein
MDMSKTNMDAKVVNVDQYIMHRRHHQQHHTHATSLAVIWVALMGLIKIDMGVFSVNVNQ